jgi:hypothetical protein
MTRLYLMKGVTWGGLKLSIMSWTIGNDTESALRFASAGTAPAGITAAGVTYA